MSARIVRIKTWEEFKQSAIKHNSQSFVYGIEQAALSPQKDLTVLRLMMPTSEGLFLLLDFSDGNMLRQTGIPVRVGRFGNRFIEDDDVMDFLKKQLKREDVSICAYKPL